MEEKHIYHCSVCGELLSELGLGMLRCEKCSTTFIPSYDKESGMQSLSWIIVKPTQLEI